MSMHSPTTHRPLRFVRPNARFRDLFKVELLFLKVQNNVIRRKEYCRRSYCRYYRLRPIVNEYTITTI